MSALVVEVCEVKAVRHLCAPDNRFIAPTSFPGVHTLEGYAEDYAKIMRQVDDLHFVAFSVRFAQGDRLSAGHSRGEPRRRATRGRPDHRE